MIEARATVLRATADRAWVRVGDRPGGCGRCDEPGGCRSAKLAYALKAPTEEFVLPNAIGARAGDEVLIRIADGGPLRGALASYGLGVVLLLVGAGAGHAFSTMTASNADLFALVGASAGLLAAVLLNRLMLRSSRWRGVLGVEMVPGGSPSSCATRCEEPA